MADSEQDALELEIPDQGQLPSLPAGAQGPVERAVRQAIQAAGLNPVDQAAGELAAAQARSVDAALVGKPNPYAVAAISRELSNQLARLLLDPASRGQGQAGEDAGWARFQEDLADAVRNGGAGDGAT